MFVAADLADRCRKAALDDVGLATDDELCGRRGRAGGGPVGVGCGRGSRVGRARGPRGVRSRLRVCRRQSWVADRTRCARGVVATRVRVATKLRTVWVRWTRRWVRGGSGSSTPGCWSRRPTRASPSRSTAGPGAAGRSAGRAPFAIWRRAVAELVGLWDQDGGYDPDRELARNRLRLDRVGDTTVIDGELVGETALVVGQAVEAESDRLWRRYRNRRRDLPRARRSRHVRRCGLWRWPSCAATPWAPTPRPAGPAVDVTLVIHADEPEVVRTLDGDRVARDACGHLLCDPVPAHPARRPARRAARLEAQRAVRHPGPAPGPGRSRRRVRVPRL